MPQVDDEFLNTVSAALSARHAAQSPGEFAQESGLACDLVTNALASLAGSGAAIALPDGRYLSPAAANRLIETAKRTVATFHKRNPLRRAMPRGGDLRTALAKAAETPDYNAALAFLIDNNILVHESLTGGDGVRLPDHAVQIPDRWRVPMEEIREVYRGAGLNPPAPGNFQANLPRDIRVESILTVLAETGELVPLGDGIYLARETVDSMAGTLRRLAVEGTEITVATVRDLTGSSRRVIVPLLEYFDSRGLTVRDGERRVWNE